MRPLRMSTRSATRARTAATGARRRRRTAPSICPSRDRFGHQTLAGPSTGEGSGLELLVISGHVSYVALRDLTAAAFLPQTRLDNVLFAHDAWFHKDVDGRVFSSRGGWQWERYLEFADSLTVASRMDTLPAQSLDELEDVTREGVEFLEVPSLSGPLVRFKHRREVRERLTAALLRADALVARLPSEVGSMAVNVAERLRKPYAVEVVTCTWDALWHRGGLQGKLYAPESWRSTRSIVRRAPFCLYVTGDFLQRRYPSPGRTAAISDVELPPFDDAVLARRLAAIRSHRSPFVIGTIAALSVRFKGVQTALSALGESLRDLPAFELQIVGSGDASPWRERARREGVEDSTSFLGVLQRDRVLPWLDRVDLYIQPSFQEGLPRALIEAMSRGCPALGSTAGGIPELLGSECLHRPGDAKTLGKLVRDAASDGTWQEGQARRNFATARRYERATLDAERARFWEEFVQHVLARK